MRCRLERFTVVLGLCAGCFGDPPAQDTEATSVAGTEGSASDATGGSATMSSPTSTGDDTRGSSSDAEAEAEAESGTRGPADTSTGPTPVCGDGTFETGELCIDRDAAWVRTLDGDIADLALASIGGDPGDGGVLVARNVDTAFYPWAWDGASPVGPTLGGPFDQPGAPLFVKSGAFSAEGRDGYLVATTTQIRRWYEDDGVLTFDACPFEGELAAVGNLDDDPELELVFTGEDPMEVNAWLDLTGAEWCMGTTAGFPLAGKRNAIALGPFLGDAPDDIAMVFTTMFAIGEVAPPFSIGDTASTDIAVSFRFAEPADLDGDGVRDELVVASISQVVPVWPSGPTMLGEGTPAGTVADIAVADLDGDGDDDVVVVDRTVPGSLFLINTGARTFSAVPGPETASPNVAVAAGDLDGDSAVDLVLGGTDDNVRAFLANP